MGTAEGAEWKARLEETLGRNFGRTAAEATPAQMFRACAMVVRDRMMAGRMASKAKTAKSGARQVHYLSMEFLLGRSLVKNAWNLGILPALREAVEALGFDFDEIIEQEPDAALGNGGLGRLAACYLESMTTQEIPAAGYSICYSLGAFRQKLVEGRQVELPDEWLDRGDVWLIPREEEVERVEFGGRVDARWENGRLKVELRESTMVLAVPMDMEIAGYATDHTNVLRLWDARSPQGEDMDCYSAGDYLKAVEQRAMAEVIAKVLYPPDGHDEGRSLRLKQQYFFVSATVQSICRRHKARYGTLKNLREKHVIQINDTHPALVIPELMRLLLDGEGYSWEEAWDTVTHTVAYTNHTVLPEALERWPQGLVERLLPRIWQLLQEINTRYLAALRAACPGEKAKWREMAVIWGGEVRMANLCAAACFSVNGVSQLHTEILTRQVFPAVWARTPEKFRAVTNGVDHRRWLAQINPGLHSLICELTGGGDYLLHPEKLEELARWREAPGVLDRLERVKAENKARLARWVQETAGVALNTGAIFDVQAKRLHEYKRQLLNVLHILALYRRLREDPGADLYPRVFLFGAKAAPGYAAAKRLVELISSVAAQVNGDRACRDRLQVVFLENYRVSAAEVLVPAAEVSEQISLAGKEASGTGNMKFMMNGALTVGTLDGANIELRRRAGEENFFLFGLTAEEADTLRRRGYDSCGYYSSNEALRGAVDLLRTGFSDGKQYDDIADRLLFGRGGPADEYMVLADFESYCRAQAAVDRAYRDRRGWARRSLLNIAHSGYFAADRAVKQYAGEIWHVPVRQL